ncbi:hypothetical protein EPUS_04917 [Endocarpon pusillum Z07020]|uniref:SRR1-like domain-containing protein n=1 Tax=Endocarpon pusillum (strain Z07020 / HMAS-L-300199) TaxID=1263415 RepID=U1GQY0_ENDPU|nr:uncharacterized protein EPUS_04917 [Endocarpon pusillum Z07020]ERF74748.1 hypothetical protein EPUS_04917 [Endocarpon pusillum Z07020]
MPHTSHKKRRQRQEPLPRNKRGEIESEDGWTRIARSDKAFSINRRHPEADTGGMISSPNDPDYDQDLDEGYTQMTFTPTPAETPAGASLEKALSHYQKSDSAWKQSNTWAELKQTFDTRISTEHLNITNCICFGLSSPTGLTGAGFDRRDISMYQLAAFKSIIDLLSSQQAQPPAAFAQEPQFNTLDHQLLAHLDIQAVHHPAAFHLITAQSFTFCPGAEHREWVPNDLPGAERAELMERIRRDAVRGAGIFHRFKKGKQSFRLPDFGHEYALYNVYLFWRSSSAEGEEEGEEV